MARLEGRPSLEEGDLRGPLKDFTWHDPRVVLNWKNYESKANLNLVLRLVKYRNDWFTCLKYEDVEPTNNGSERDIRKNVTARKISGAHRSEVGMHCREIMMSGLLTLQKKGQNPFEFVLNGVRTHNSGGLKS